LTICKFAANPVGDRGVADVKSDGDSKKINPLEFCEEAVGDPTAAVPGNTDPFKKTENWQGSLWYTLKYRW
jgi:hypothetical protein